MTPETAKKFKKKFFNRFNSVDKVDISAGDIQKIDQWLKILNKENPHFEIPVEPLIKNCAIITQTIDGKDANGLALRFKVIEDEVYEFKLYKPLNNELPNKPQLIFHISNIKRGETPGGKGIVPSNVSDEKMQGHFDIDIIDYTEKAPYDELKQAATDIFQYWVSINYFLINFERDVHISTYKYTLQNKGGGRGKQSKRIILSKLYRCRLPENWVARNEKEYRVAQWSRRGHWMPINVNEDYFERYPERLENDRYKFIGPHPTIEGKIIIEVWLDAKEDIARRLPLIEEASGNKNKTYVI